jgi:hypothetical protein
LPLGQGRDRRLRRLPVELGHRGLELLDEGKYRLCAVAARNSLDQPRPLRVGRARHGASPVQIQVFAVANLADYFSLLLRRHLGALACGRRQALIVRTRLSQLAEAEDGHRQPNGNGRDYVARPKNGEAHFASLRNE